MSNMNVILKQSKGEILQVSAAEAVKLGLALPARRAMGVNGKRIYIPPVPAGLGVFAKFAVQIIDANGTQALAKCDQEERAILGSGLDEKATAAVRAKYAQRRAAIIAFHAVHFRSPKTGRMVKKISRPVHSFTRNFGQFVRGFLQNADGATLNLNETLVDDAGASFLTRLKSNPSGNNIAIVSALAKMKFGNSSAALSTTQFNLQGVLLGPTTEATVVVALVVEDSTNTIFTCTGQITNGTGGAFTVEEMGLFSELGSTTGVANNTTMMLRDLTGSVAVANGQTIIGVYTFTIAV